MKWIDPKKELPKFDQLCWLYYKGRLENHIDLDKGYIDSEVFLGVYKGTDRFKEGVHIPTWEGLDNCSAYYAEETCYWMVIGWMPYDEFFKPVWEELE